MQMIQAYPFLRPLIFLSLGILGSRYVLPENAEKPVILLVIVVFSLASTLKSNLFSGIICSLLTSLIGMLLAGQNIHKDAFRVPVLEDSLYVLELIKLKSGNKHTSLEARMIYPKLDQFGSEQPGVLLYIRDSVGGLSPNDTLFLRGSLSEIEGPDLDYHFDRRSYYANKGIYFQGFANLKEVSVNHYKAYSFEQWRNDLLNATRDKLEVLGFKEQEREYLMALGLGDKSRLSEELKSSYQHLGLSHILAVSGLHVGIIWLLVYSLLGFIPLLRTILFRYSLSLMLIWLYVLVCGAGPSVLRAAIMLSLYAIAKLLQRKTHTLNVIFAAAFMLLCWKPNFIYDLGFQLSFSAVIAICAVMPSLRPFVQSHKAILRKPLDLMLISLIATTATSPLSLFYFGQISNVFLITNLLFLPAVALELYSFLFLLLCLLPDIWVQYIAIPIIYMLELKHQAIAFISEFEFVFTHIRLDEKLELMMIYLLLVFGSYIFLRRKLQMIKYLLILLVLYFALSPGISDEAQIMQSKAGKGWLEYRMDESVVVIADTSKPGLSYYTDQLFKNWESVKVLHPAETEYSKRYALRRKTFICSDTLIYLDNR